MTSKFKCPMCGHKLALETEHEDKLLETMYCPTCKHFMLGNYRIWQALIQSQKDLEIARNALKDARIFAYTRCIATAVKTIDKAFKRIEHKDEK